MRLFQHHYASLREGKETRTVFLKEVLIDGSELTDAFKKRCSVEKGTILGKKSVNSAIAPPLPNAIFMQLKKVNFSVEILQTNYF